MSEQEFNVIFAKRLRFYLDEYNITQKELADRLGVGTTSVYNWLHAVKTPRMDKVDAMCKIFNCKRSDLMQDVPDRSSTAPYYLNDEAREMAEFMYNNPEYKVLFKASRKVKPEDIDFVRKMIERLAGGNAEDGTGC